MPISSCLDERLMPKVGPDPSATSVPVHGAGEPRAATSLIFGSFLMGWEIRLITIVQIGLCHGVEN
jgi:hypothetical protein